jgi:tetratricopeptide (TPR) repeat protein
LKNLPKNREGVFMMPKKKFLLLSLMFTVFILSAPVMNAGVEAQEVNKGERSYIERGMGYFNKGYYDEIPKGKALEASQSLDRAIEEFKQAILVNKDSVQAHRNLARAYYVQKRYLEAALQYRKVTDLNPSDINTYVLTALAYTRVQKFAEAIEQLKTARTFTSDETVIQKLDDYIHKIEEEKRPR